MDLEVQKLVSAGHNAIAVRCDVSDDAQVDQMVGCTVAEFGRLDAEFKNQARHTRECGESRPNRYASRP